MNETGYLSDAYALSLAEFGTPYPLPNAHAWLIQREIGGTNYCDAMGCYPLFCCQRWDLLRQDLESIASDFVSVTVVTDPFGAYSEQTLQKAFPHLVRPFKRHYIIDLSVFPSPIHHPQNVKRAQKTLKLEYCSDAEGYFEDWVRLYSILCQRHNIRGIAKFSPASFRKQLEIPGLYLFRASLNDITVGMTLWFRQQDVVYHHLAAYDTEGYRYCASFGLYALAIDYFREQGAAWIDLGASAGLNEAEDGLSLFKQGWSTDRKTVYLCGRIFNPEVYARLSAMKTSQPTEYFPAYRTGS